MTLTTDRTSCCCSENGKTMVALDRLEALRRRDEEVYSCGDYLARQDQHQQQQEQWNGTNAATTTPHNPLMIDEVCREKMVGWAYKVCGHFDTPRELVAASFSLLDRFLDKSTSPQQVVDRNTFKLAAMTSLYTTIKVCNHAQMSMDTVTLMGGGEYETRHVEHMERLLAHTLDWYLCPPTPQAFVRLLWQDLFAPTVLATTTSTTGGAVADVLQQEESADSVLRNATYFAELAVYDYQLVPHLKLHVALGCILNSIEGGENGNENLQGSFLRTMEPILGVSHVAKQIAYIQGRLWALFAACSSSSSPAPSSSSEQREFVRPAHASVGCISSPSSPTTAAGLHYHPYQQHQEQKLQQHLQSHEQEQQLQQQQHVSPVCVQMNGR